MKECVFCGKEMTSGYLICDECAERIGTKPNGCRHKKENGMCASIESEIFYQECNRKPTECPEAE